MVMELSDSQQLTYLVENLTTNGKNGLDKPNLKKLKSFCKKSDEFLERTFHLIFSQLEQDHSEIRLATVLLIDELFQRSHLFRSLLLDEFNEFLELAAGINFDRPLPEPNLCAKELLKKTVKLVHEWHEKYGTAYKKLSLGYRFLKGTKKVQLINADEVQTEIQRNAAEARLQKKEEMNRKKLEKIVEEINSDMVEIASCVAEMEACLSLLIPKFTEEDDDHNMKDDAEAINIESSRASGIPSFNYNIVLSIPGQILNYVEINSTEDNEVILENLHDREKVLERTHLPKLKKWLMELGACGAPSDIVRQAIDLKTAILKSLAKSKDLVIKSIGSTPCSSKPNDTLNSIGYETDSSSDGDFIEVPDKVIDDPPLQVGYNRKKGSIKKRMKKKKDASCDLKAVETSVWKPIRDDDCIDDPASYSRALANQRVQLEKKKSYDTSKSSSQFKKIHPKVVCKDIFGGSSQDDALNSTRRKAPIVPFGSDLLEWDEAKKRELKETLSMGMAREMDIGHRFWSGDTAAKGDQVSDAALTALTTRSISFTEDFKPVNHRCRAPLPNGKLCPRMDRFKCPFHGLIIPRDSSGYPIDQREREKFERNKRHAANNWQDPVLLEELRVATGVDLRMPKTSGKKRKKSRKYENLTDVKNMKNNSRFRLEKKVFNPQSIKRISETLDRIDTKRTFQKFGNNFNYALN